MYTDNSAHHTHMMSAWSPIIFFLKKSDELKTQNLSKNQSVSKYIMVAPKSHRAGMNFLLSGGAVHSWELFSKHKLARLSGSYRGKNHENHPLLPSLTCIILLYVCIQWFNLQCISLNHCKFEYDCRQPSMTLQYSFSKWLVSITLTLGVYCFTTKVNTEFLTYGIRLTRSIVNSFHVNSSQNM